MAPIRILYEDPYLVLCVKPVGVLSEDSPSGACMPGLLREHYRPLGQNDYIATVHRLDRLGGGVLLFFPPPGGPGAGQPVDSGLHIGGYRKIRGGCSRKTDRKAESGKYYCQGVGSQSDGRPYEP